MYINFKHDPPPEQPMDKEWVQGMSGAKIAELTEARHLRGIVDDVDIIVEQNKLYKQVMAEKAIGRPGHYYGRDIVLEGSLPIAAFIAAAQEFDGDAEWWRDDAKFQKYMKTHSEYSWLNG